MARAIRGDYKIPAGLRCLSQEEMQKYKFVDTIGNYSLYYLNVSFNDNYDYILGYFKNNTFKKIAKIYFNKIDEFYEVDTIYISSDMRGQEIASMLYSYFVKEHDYIILGSDMQRFGARKLWASLSRRSDLTVDIIDVKTDKVLEKDTIIRHGDLDEEFDERVWSYDIDKKHIRLVLKDIK